MGRARILAWDISALLVTALVAFLLVPSLRGPRFEVSNKSTEVVFVSATWAGQRKEIGPVRPSATHTFTLDGEAAIRFGARFPTGRVMESESIYFSSGMTVLVTITARGVEVRYDFET